ncbi:hypothetical protein ACXJJ3_31365 [Kribbella sp. WER1]
MLVEKAAVVQSFSDQVAFYNFVAGILLQQVLETADEWPGGRRDLVISFGHVRGFDHAETLAWFEKLQAQDTSEVSWELLRGKPSFVGAGQLDGLQAADQYCGMLRAALEADEYGGFEAFVLPETPAAYKWWPPDGS